MNFGVYIFPKLLCICSAVKAFQNQSGLNYLPFCGPKTPVGNWQKGKKAVNGKTFDITDQYIVYIK